MVRLALSGYPVFDAAIDRLVELYSDPLKRLIVAFSAGKDSGVVMELAIIAARMTDRLPVEVVMRDEEVMYPGTFEYCERVRARTDEVTFHWVIANQPVVNCFNREQPYWWVFDPLLDPSEWVRQPPPYAEYITHNSLTRAMDASRFPPPEGGELIPIVGLRGAESPWRRMGIHSSGGHLTRTKHPVSGLRYTRPIYDWLDGDVWRAISVMRWDYNSAYDLMYKMGWPPVELRIAPPTLSPAAARFLPLAAKAWPFWFDTVSRRLPGIRTVGQFGSAVLVPTRQSTETWKQTFQRECIDNAPSWIAERAEQAVRVVEATHRAHSTGPIPDSRPCELCGGGQASYRKLAYAVYHGDPFSTKLKFLPEVEPEFFRPGAGKWDGGAAWSG